jgi:hypothetical protein
MFKYLKKFFKNAMLSNERIEDSFKTVKEAFSKKPIEEKAEDFLKKNKKVKRFDFWIFIGDEYKAEEILQDLYDRKMVKLLEDNGHTYIIWNIQET